MIMKKILALGLVLATVSFFGCSKKQDVKPDDGMGDGSAMSDESVSGMTDSDSGNAMGLQTVHFPYDSFEIVGENRAILRENVDIIKQNPGLNVQIEGHCDDRGGIQYNLALGEKRANAVKQQMMGMG